MPSRTLIKINTMKKLINFYSCSFLKKNECGIIIYALIVITSSVVNIVVCSCRRAYVLLSFLSTTISIEEDLVLISISPFKMIFFELLAFNNNT